MLDPALIAAAYLFGSIPTGAWLGKLAGVDVQRHGSGNIGATNVARTVGLRLGLITLLADVLKGFVPVVAAQWWSGAVDVAALAGTAAVLGHMFSIFLAFRGGKGVATGLGVFLALAPLAGLAAMFAFGLTFALTRYVSLGSILGSAALPVACAVFAYRPEVNAAALLIAVLIVWRHRDNLQRLWSGSESRFRPKR